MNKMRLNKNQKTRGDFLKEKNVYDNCIIFVAWIFIQIPGNLEEGQFFQKWVCMQVYVFLRVLYSPFHNML